MEKCTEERRFANIETDVKELKDTVQINRTDINSLKEGHAETRIYVKQIFERIDDIKALFKSSTAGSNAEWRKVLIEVVKMIGIVAAIIAGIKFI